MKSFQSFSCELDMKNSFKGYTETPTKAKETLPKSPNRKVDFNYISLNTLLKTSYCTGESSSLYADAQGVFNPGNIFSVVLSDSIGSFSNPTIIGTLSSNSPGVQTIDFRFPVNVSLGTGYRIRIVASNPLTTSPDNNFDIQVTTIPVPVSTNQVICAGQSVALNATCNTGMLKWYKSASGDTLLTNTTVSPTVTTNYFPACEDGTTCYSRRKVHTVTVNHLTGVSLAPAFSSCEGSDLTLPVVTSQNDLTYAWTGPNSFTSTTKIASITNLTTAKTGTYSVVVTSPNSCFFTATTSVSIGTALPNLSISGDTLICYNGTINLTAESGNVSGVTYSWTGPHSFTATGQNISRSAFTNNGQGLTTYNDGAYVVTATNPTTGCTGTVSKNIYVGNRPNVPVIPPPIDICEGTSHDIVVGFGGANFQNYSWTGPNSFTSTAIATCNPAFECNDATISLTNFSASNVGTYSVVGYFKDVNNKTCSINASTTLGIKTKPEITISSNSAICVGQNLNFTASATGAASSISSYTWTGPNNFASSVQNPSVSAATANAAGVYTLVVVGANQCEATATANAVVTESFPPVVTPTAQVVLSNSITLTASGCAGTVDWYKASDNQSVTMPVSPTVKTLYYAKCYLSGCVSAKSEDITVTIGAPIAISIKSGNWNDRTTWNIDRVPLAIDSVIIDENHTVMIQGQYSAKWMSFRGNGTISFGSISGNLNLLGNPPPPKTTTPTLLSVAENQIVYSNYTNGTTVKLFKNGVYINQTIVANGNTWTGLALSAGLYTITTTDADFSESVQSNAIQFTPQTLTPTLSTVTGSQITFSDYTNGTTIKIYKDGVYTNLSSVVNSGTWADLSLVSGTYTITSTESGKSESVQSNAIQYSSLPLTATPTLLSVNATYITYTNYTPGAVFKLYKDGVFTGDTFVSNGNEWSGLYLGTGLYTYTATESGKAESAQSNAIQFTQPSGQTTTPTLLTVTGNAITYSNYTDGTLLKLFKNGIYIYQAYTANSNQWSGLNLTSGSYTITATESGKYESVQSNAIQYTQPTGQTSTPTLLTVTGNAITYSDFTVGTLLKLYRNGTYINQSYSAYFNQWSGLNLASGLYTITATESGKNESSQSNSIQYTSTSNQTATPILLTVSGTRISFSNYTNGATIKLYKNGVYSNLSQVVNSNEWTGLSLTSGTYSITATEPSKTESGQSNSEIFNTPSANVIITEPNKPQYYFSDGHPASYYDGNLNLPTIFTNQPRYDPVNDMVWLKNDKIKIGINLKRGGQLAWASLLDATTNLVYNGYDGGFQVTLDAYQRKDGYTQGGEVSGSGIPGQPTFSYNVTQGGDFLNHAVSLIDYHSIPNGYYVKVRPIHYPLTAKHSETFIEAWYTIIRQSVKIQYRYTSFRTDGQWNGAGFDGAGAPACFIVNTLNHYKTYTGSSPWTFSSGQIGDSGVLPIQNMGGVPLGKQATEHWGMVYDPQRPNSGIGVYNNTENSSSTYFTFKQLEVYPGNGPGTEFTNGFTFFQAFTNFNNIQNRGSYVKDITAYLMLGTEFEIRAEAYRISGHEGNIPQY
jgi:Ig-like domain CHU_C associated